MSHAAQRHPGYHLWRRTIQTKHGSISFRSDIEKWLIRKVGVAWCVWRPGEDRPRYQFLTHPLYLAPFKKIERQESCL